MTNIAYELGNQVQEKLETSEGISSITYESLLVMGMGGSGVSGDVLKLLSDTVTSTEVTVIKNYNCLLYTSPSPRDVEESRMPSSA